MSRIDPETSPVYYPQPQPLVTGALPILALVPDDELETPPLPREHPKWAKDSLAVSARARALLQRLRPVIVRILTFWDHQMRTIRIGGRNMHVDVSGCYRID
jgi:hypothetical protein